MGEFQNEESDQDDQSAKSPLLKASQERNSNNLHQSPSLGDVFLWSENIPVKMKDERSSTVLLRRMREGTTLDQNREIDFHYPAKKKHRSEFKREKKEEGNDPFIAPPAQIFDAASILLSMGHGCSVEVRRGRSASKLLSKQKVINYEENDQEEVEEELRQTEDVTPVSPKTDTEMRNFPSDIPIHSDDFPNLYQRYHVPSTVAKEKRENIFRKSKPSNSQDKQFHLIAERGSKTLGVWNEPFDLLDLYTPRWVRGHLAKKEGMCTICYEQDPTKINFKRTKTSQYNYHLINQHGISPHTRLPFDPPIAFRTRQQNNPLAYQRKEMIQGKCHVCKQFVDMQSKNIGQVKVPEIYWWKHASVCHKNKPKLGGTGGIFVQDEVSLESSFMIPDSFVHL